MENPRLDIVDNSLIIALTCDDVDSSKAKERLGMEMMKIKRELGGQIISSLNLYVLDNDDPAHDMRPFAIIENVRTLEGYENRGLASDILTEAIEKAREAGCYKITLTTSSSKPNVPHLYSKIGFTNDYKSAWYMPLDD